MAEELLVTALAGEQKLFNFLKRSLVAENNEIHRWIRTGQVRINGKRAKAFDLVHEGDLVRIPPFARSQNHEEAKPSKNATNTPQKFPFSVIYENEHILVIDKPQGIACQGGTGQEKNIADILKVYYAHADFIPAPAHRLDKETTGLLFIGKSYQGLRFLADFLKGDEENLQKNFLKQPKKIYRALVHGDISDFAQKNPYLCHYLYHDEERKKEQVYRKYQVKNRGDIQKILENNGLVQIMTNKAKALFALSTLKVLHVRNQQSLVEIGIYTGRKHQIRVQLASSGFPLVGDKKYCPKQYQESSDTFFLQAYQVLLSENPFTTQSVFRVMQEKR